MTPLRSAINLEIWHRLRAHGIQIAYPQRVLHTVAPTYFDESAMPYAGYTAMHTGAGQAVDAAQPTASQPGTGPDSAPPAGASVSK